MLLEMEFVNPVFSIFIHHLAYGGQGNLFESVL